MRHDSVLAAKGYGVRELGKPDRVDENTVFSIASLTKSFTATAAAMLVDDGKLAWDAPVRRYLPTFALGDPYLTDAITVRDLLSHRTGLHGSNMAWVVTDVDRAELLRRTRYLQPERPFRTTQVYSNVGFTIAGELAAAAGTSYEALVRTRIFLPLGMRSTTITMSALANQPNRVSPHAVIGGVQRPIPWRDIDVIAPAGAINSTAADMAQWLRFQLGDGTFGGRRLVSAEGLWEIHSPQVVITVTPAMKRARLVEGWGAYALGWNVMDYRGHPMVWHSGNADGQPSIMALLPNDGLGVVVMTNTWAAGLLHAMILNRVMDTYLGAPPRDWSGEMLARKTQIRDQYAQSLHALEATRVAGTKPSHPIADYAGTYTDSLYGDEIVHLDGKALTLRMGRGQVADLSHWSYDTFLVTWRDPLFRELYPALATFGLDADGRVRRITMSLNRDLIEGKKSGE